MARSRDGFSGDVAGESALMAPFPASERRFSGGDSRNRRGKERGPHLPIGNAAISGDGRHKRRRRVLTRRELGLRLSGGGRRLTIIGLRRLLQRPDRTAAEPGVAGPVEDRDDLLEPGNGEVGRFAEIEVM